MKKGDVFAMDGIVYVVEKTISCVENDYITKEDALLFLEAGFISMKRPVYSNYLIKVYENDKLIKAYVASESDAKIEDYVSNLSEVYNVRQRETESVFLVTYEKVHPNETA